MALAVVVLSRLINFHPGYTFGAVAGFTIATELGRREKGRLGVWSILSIVGVALLAWVAWLPVHRMASAGDPSMGIVILETALVCTFMLGLETALVLALPIRFVHGGDVAEWNRWIWAATFALVAFPVLHILLADGNHTASGGGGSAGLGDHRGDGLLRRLHRRLLGLLPLPPRAVALGSRRLRPDELPRCSSRPGGRSR